MKLVRRLAKITLIGLSGLLVQGDSLNPPPKVPEAQVILPQESVVIKYKAPEDFKISVTSSQTLPQLSSDFINHPLQRRGQDGKMHNIKKIIRKGMESKIAQDYILDLLKPLQLKYEKASIATLPLAKEAINILRQDINTDDGYGIYTQALEVSDSEWYNQKTPEEKAALRKVIKGINLLDPFTRILATMTLPDAIRSKLNISIDSDQSLDEFISQNYEKHIIKAIKEERSGKTGKKAYVGDCDDFAMALVTGYELMVHFSNTREGKFWKTLSQGFKRYKVIGVGITSHMMNASIEYSPDFKEATIIPIEPQGNNYNLDSQTSRRTEDEAFIIDPKKGLAFYERLSSGQKKGDIETSEVDMLFNLTTTYVKKRYIKKD